jgi:hypothetical protein
VHLRLAPGCLRLGVMTNATLATRVYRLIQSAPAITVTAMARRLRVSRARIYRAYPEVKFRCHGRIASTSFGTPPLTDALAAFASHFGEFDELRGERGISRAAETVRP